MGREQSNNSIMRNRPVHRLGGRALVLPELAPVFVSPVMSLKSHLDMLGPRARVMIDHLDVLKNTKCLTSCTVVNMIIA